MHLRMNETEQPTAAYDMARQQRRFNEFRRCYNEERPHEALGQKTPASVYRASERRHTGKLQEPHYEVGVETRKVQKAGEFSWRGEPVFLSETLRGETIGLEQISGERWQIRFGALVLGTISNRTMKIVPVGGAKKRRKKAHSATGKMRWGPRRTALRRGRSLRSRPLRSAVATTKDATDKKRFIDSRV
jgi:hypothetical protein